MRTRLRCSVVVEREEVRLASVDISGGARVAEQPGPVRRTLPEKLVYLFATVKPPGELGREYTIREVAERATAGGHPISASHVHQLKTDAAKNPSLKALEALAAAFEVSVAYFFNDENAARIERDLELLAALRSSQVREVAKRVDGLSEEALASIMSIIDRAREWDGLGKWEGDQSPGGPEG